MNISRIGFDPELAIVNKKTGLARSAHMFIGDENVKISTNNKVDQGDPFGWASEVSRDGPGLEYRSLYGTSCRDSIIPYLAFAVRYSGLRLAEWEKNTFKLSSTPKYVLDDESFVNAPENVSMFGCNPDFDAYAMMEKTPRLDPGDRRRWTGGHVHESKTNCDFENVAALAILYDYYVTLPFVSILNEKFAEGEAERRLFYGQPGSFRYDEKLDKIEFRALSGRLLLHPALTYWASGAMKAFINSLKSQPAEEVRRLMSVIPLEKIHETIMKHDVEASLALTPEIYRLAPGYNPNEVLKPTVYGTSNLFWYEQAWRVFTEAQKAGKFWDDDMVYNWGIYPNYRIEHHQFWGASNVMHGACDDMIVPFNDIAREFFEPVKSDFRLYHPLNKDAKVKHVGSYWGQAGQL